MFRRQPPPQRPAYEVPTHAQPQKAVPSTSSPRKRKMKKNRVSSKDNLRATEEARKAQTYSQLYDTLANEEGGGTFSAFVPAPLTSRSEGGGGPQTPTTDRAATTQSTLSALSKLIKQEIVNWSNEINGLELPSDQGVDEYDGGDGSDRSYIRRMHNLHLSDSEYSANFGVKALQKEFGEVQIYTPVAVTRMDEERKKKVSSVTEASLKMQRTIRVLRSAIRTYNQNRKPDDLVTLKEALANSGVVLQKSAANRRNSRRTSEVLHATFNMAMGEIGKKADEPISENNGRKTPQDLAEMKDDLPDFLLSSDEEFDDEEDMSRGASCGGHDSPMPTPMASPRSLVGMAKKEDRVERRKTRASVLDALKSDPSLRKKARKKAPFHLQEDKLKNVSWFTSICDHTAERTVMGTLSHIGDLQRDIMVSRKKKFDEENKVNYDKQRRRSLMLVQEVATRNYNVEILENQKKDLQKDLNISIKRYTAANIKLEKEELERRREVRKFQMEKEAFRIEKYNVMQLFDAANKKMLADMRMQLETAEAKVKAENGKIDELLRYISDVTKTVKKEKEDDRMRRKTLSASQKDVMQVKAELDALKMEIKEKSDLYLGCVEEIKGLKEENEKLKGLVEEEAREEENEAGGGEGGEREVAAAVGGEGEKGKGEEKVAEEGGKEKGEEKVMDEGEKGEEKNEDDGKAAESVQEGGTEAST